MGVYGYDGDAALTSSAVDFKATAAPSKQSRLIVTDTKAGGIGTNLLVGIEAIGFSDQYIEVQGRENAWSWTDWTGTTIAEKSIEGTLFSEEPWVELVLIAFRDVVAMMSFAALVVVTVCAVVPATTH